MRRTSRNGPPRQTTKISIKCNASSARYNFERSRSKKQRVEGDATASAEELQSAVGGVFVCVQGERVLLEEVTDEQLSRMDAAEYEVFYRH